MKGLYIHFGIQARVPKISAKISLASTFRRAPHAGVDEPASSGNSQSQPAEPGYADFAAPVVHETITNYIELFDLIFQKTHSHGLSEPYSSTSHEYPLLEGTQKGKAKNPAYTRLVCNGQFYTEG